MKLPVGIKAAIITGSCAVIAAVLGIVYSSHNSGKSGATQENSPAAVHASQQKTKDSTLAVQEAGGAQSIQSGQNNIQTTISASNMMQSFTYNISVGPAKDNAEAIDGILNRLSTTETNLAGTRQAVEALAKVVKDIDERTSAMVLLPDGRSKYFDVIAGDATLQYAEYQIAWTNTAAQNWCEGLKHSEAAIRMYEDSKKMGEGSDRGNYTPDEFASTLYFMASCNAQPLFHQTVNTKYAELAYQYGKESSRLARTADHVAAEAVGLYQLLRWEEATNKISQAVSLDPNNSQVAEIQKNMISNHVVAHLPPKPGTKVNPCD